MTDRDKFKAENLGVHYGVPAPESKTRVEYYISQGSGLLYRVEVSETHEEVTGLSYPADNRWTRPIGTTDQRAKAARIRNSSGYFVRVHDTVGERVQ